MISLLCLDGHLRSVVVHPRVLEELFRERVGHVEQRRGVEAEQDEPQHQRRQQAELATPQVGHRVATGVDVRLEVLGVRPGEHLLVGPEHVDRGQDDAGDGDRADVPAVVERCDQHQDLRDELAQPRQTRGGQRGDEEQPGRHRRDLLEAAHPADQRGAPTLDDEAGDQEQRGGRDPVVDHVEDRAVGALVGEHEDAERDEAEVAQRGQADQPQDVVLADCQERAVDDRDQGQHHDQRRSPVGGLREQAEAEPQHAEGGDLVEHAHQQHAGRRRRLLRGVGQPGVDREQRCLGGERDEEAGEEPPARARGDVELLQVVDEVRRGAGVGGDDVEPDHRAEQHQPASQLEHQELQRGGRALLAAEATDEEVRRDQRRLEDDVEEEDVGREEDHERQGLEGQRPGEPRLALVIGAVVPGGEDHDRDEYDGEQHQQQPEPVEPDRVVDAERFDPVVGLGQLEAGAVAVELRRSADPDTEGHHRDRQCGQLCGRALGAERGHERPHEGDHPEDGEPGEVVHARFTASSTRTTRSTPPSSERA